MADVVFLQTDRYTGRFPPPGSRSQTFSLPDSKVEVEMGQLGSAVSSSASLTTSYAAMALDVPRDFRGGNLSLKLTSISGAASVTWYLSADSAGIEPITPVRSADGIIAVSTSGGVASSLENVAIHCWATNPQVWVQAKLDAGTATAVARISWEQ